ncbi:MAG: aquaporin family protein [Bacilli bacterium]|nr:aquaporin family protein [Bacilli bacterium]
MVSIKKQCISEFLCSLLVGFFGLSCLVLLSPQEHLIDQYEFSMLFGLAIAFTVLIFAPVSGAQFNPGITLAMVITKRQDKKTLLPYIGAQLVGWFCGAAMVYGVFYNVISKMAVNDAVQLLYCNYNTGQWFAAIPLELIFTAFLIIVVIASNDERIVNKPSRALFPLVLALYITFAVTIAGPYSGACFNWTRDFGPRLFALIWGAAHGADLSLVFGPDCQALLYLFVPAVGAVLGAIVYDFGIARLLPKVKTAVKEKESKPKSKK